MRKEKDRIKSQERRDRLKAEKAQQQRDNPLLIVRVPTVREKNERRKEQQRIYAQQKRDKLRAEKEANSDPSNVPTGPSKEERKERRAEWHRRYAQQRRDRIKAEKERAEQTSVQAGPSASAEMAQVGPSASCQSAIGAAETSLIDFGDETVR